MANSLQIAEPQIFNIYLLIFRDRAFYPSISFELFWRYRLERRLQKISDC